jgi:hypothetical protein
MDVLLTPLGKLESEVLVYYDGPLLLACKAAEDGQQYMAHLLDRIDVTDRWLLVPMTDERMQQVRQGAMSLRDSILRVEGGHIWDITIVDGKPGRAIHADPKNLPEYELPDVGLSLTGREGESTNAG